MVSLGVCADDIILFFTHWGLFLEFHKSLQLIQEPCWFYVWLFSKYFYLAPMLLRLLPSLIFVIAMSPHCSLCLQSWLLRPMLHLPSHASSGPLLQTDEFQVPHHVLTVHYLPFWELHVVSKMIFLDFVALFMSSILLGWNWLSLDPFCNIPQI